MSAQATLHDYREQHEWTTEKFTKTTIFDLKQPTDRKQERLDRAVEAGAAIQAEAARRMPSVPRQLWSVAKPNNSTWYGWAKEMDCHLSNKAVHENIQRVREAFRSWQSNGYDGNRPSVERFADGDRCAFYYDHPKYKKHGGGYYVSLPLAAGRGERELLPLRDGEYLREYADKIRAGDLSKGRAELIKDGSGYRLHQTVRTDIEVIAEPKTTVGVDIGLANLAVAAAASQDHKQGAELWPGSEAAEMRQRFAERKQQAQSDAEYEQLRDDESRYIEHICHRISREIVEWALNHGRPEIVLEDLTDIRQTFIQREREHTPEERRALHSWPFRKLQDMIQYKSIEVGVPVRYINPKNTSKRCNNCGHVEDKNRRNIHFECVECGYAVNADVNAAFNIADG